MFIFCSRQERGVDDPDTEKFFCWRISINIQVLA